MFILGQYLHIDFLITLALDKMFSYDPDETRTRNLLIRSQTPYPLGHKADNLDIVWNEHIPILVS